LFFLLHDKERQRKKKKNLHEKFPLSQIYNLSIEFFFFFRKSRKTFFSSPPLVKRAAAQTVTSYKN
jgi:hypothetical protein